MRKSVGPWNQPAEHACEFLKPPRARVWGNNCNLFMICCCCGVGKQENTVFNAVFGGFHLSVFGIWNAKDPPYSIKSVVWVLYYLSWSVQRQSI